MTVTFIGHRDLPSDSGLEARIELALEQLMPEGERITFLCGGMGDFDALCAAVCRKLKRHYPNVELLYVTPYLTEPRQRKIRVLLEDNLYDATVYPPLETVPLRFAILKRNEWMVSQADVVLAYVTRTYGGACKALSHAQKRGKRILQLAKDAQPSCADPFA